MKTIKTTLCLSVLLIVTSRGIVAAPKETTNQQMLQMLRRINQRTEKLQNEVTSLRSQVKTLKRQLRQERQSKKVIVKKVVQTKVLPPKYVPVYMPPQQQLPLTEPPYITRQSGSVPYVNGNYGPGMRASQEPVDSQTAQEPYYKYLAFLKYAKHFTQDRDINTLTALYLGGTPVFSSPYIGIHSSYDGSNLIINASSVNLDVRLLMQQHALQEQLLREGIALPQHPVIEVSGILEGIGQITKTSPGTTNGNIDLTTAQLDTFVEVNPHVIGFMSFAYDNSQTNPIRVSNSRLSLRQGFITVANFMHSYFYGTIGQIFAPFGQYSSYFISSPLTQAVGRVRTRAIVAGYYPKNGIIGTAYVFQGDTDVGNRAQGGAQLGFTLQRHAFDATVIANYISNIAESEGMQSNAAPGGAPFRGFGRTPRTERLFHNVPGFDIEGSLAFSKFTIIGEYVTATRAFNPFDMSFNGKGAKPAAGHVELIYHYDLHGKPGTLGIAYGWTKQALALFLPQQRYMAEASISLWRYTLETIEFRHDRNYNMSDRASGARSIPFGPTNNWVNMVTAQIAIYF